MIGNQTSCWSPGAVQRTPAGGFVISSNEPEQRAKEPQFGKILVALQVVFQILFKLMHLDYPLLNSN